MRLFPLLNTEDGNQSADRADAEGNPERGIDRGAVIKHTAEQACENTADSRHGVGETLCFSRILIRNNFIDIRDDGRRVKRKGRCLQKKGCQKSRDAPCEGDGNCLQNKEKEGNAHKASRAAFSE